MDAVQTFRTITPSFRDPRNKTVLRYGLVPLAVASMLGIRMLLHPVLGESAPLLMFVLPVLLCAWYGGRGPGLASTALSGLAGWYFFLPERQSFGGLGPADAIHLAIFGAIGLTVSSLNAYLRSARGRAAASEERFRLLVEGIDDYAIFMLDPEGRVVLWNRGAQRIKGYRPEEILGRHFGIFYLPEDREAGEPGQHLRQAAEQGAWRGEEWRLRKDGSRFWASVLLTALRDPQGRLRGFAKITRDVTERKKAEDEIRSLAEGLEQRVVQRTAELEAANRALEAFAYSISHDLRAPLRGIQGFAQALLEDYGDRLDGTGHDYARRIAGAAERMDQLIQDILDYSRLSRADIELAPVSLEAALREARAEVELPLRQRGGEMSLEGPFPWVRAHRSTLVQVLTNLLSNAVLYVAPGTAPRIRVRTEERGDRWVRLWIEDQGIGIAPEHQERIFDVFERLHGSETYPGTGIGLAIVRKGVERMGGSAGVESEPGAGSRFWIELARAGEPNAA